jgi:HEAT repeat protein
MSSLRENLGRWFVELRWAWVETTWRELFVRALAWLGVITVIGAGGWWFYSCRGPAEDTSSLAEDLRSDSPYVRARAYRILGERDDSAACFAYALCDSRPQIRLEAADALACFPHSTADAVPALVDALEDEDPRIRCQAAVALGKAGSRAEEASLALHKAAEKDPDPYVQECAGVALRDLSSK